MTAEIHLCPAAPPQADRPPSEATAVTQTQYAEAYDQGFVRTKRWLLSRGISPDTAEEMAQAAWAKGWMSRGQLRDPNLILPWVNTIALNLLRRSYRRKDSVQILGEISVQPATSAGRIDLARTLGKCSSAEQTLLEKFYIEGYTSGELADQMGCSAVAIRVQLCRLRRRIASRVASSGAILTQKHCKAG